MKRKALSCTCVGYPANECQTQPTFLFFIIAPWCGFFRAKKWGCLRALVVVVSSSTSVSLSGALLLPNSHHWYQFYSREQRHRLFPLLFIPLWYLAPKVFFFFFIIRLQQPVQSAGGGGVGVHCSISQINDLDKL